MSTNEAVERARRCEILDKGVFRNESNVVERGSMRDE